MAEIKFSIEFDHPHYMEWLLSFSAAYKIKFQMIGQVSKHLYIDTTMENTSHILDSDLFKGCEKDVQDKIFDIIVDIPQANKIDYDYQYTCITGNKGQIAADHYLIGIEDFGDGDKKYDYDDVALSITNWRDSK